jgi:hypothetical protein
MRWWESIQRLTPLNCLASKKQNDCCSATWKIVTIRFRSWQKRPSFASSMTVRKIGAFISHPQSSTTCWWARLRSRSLRTFADLRSLTDYAASERSNPYKPPQKWQAQLNLIFAIGAVYSHMVSAPWRGNERDHLDYHSRAWALGMKDPWCLPQPDLPQMQVAGKFICSIASSQSNNK